MLKIILLFILFPIAELYIFIKVGNLIGAGLTVGIVLLTALGGAFLARREGLKTINKIIKILEAGGVPTDELVDAFFIFVGGILLLTPGFITDILGFFVLIPFVRHIVKESVFKLLRSKLEGKNINMNLFGGDSFDI